MITAAACSANIAASWKFWGPRNSTCSQISGTNVQTNLSSFFASDKSWIFKHVARNRKTKSTTVSFLYYHIPANLSHPPVAIILGPELLAQNLAKIFPHSREMIPLACLAPPEHCIAAQQRCCIWDLASFVNDSEVKVFVNVEQPSIQIMGLISIICISLLHLNM